MLFLMYSTAGLLLIKKGILFFTPSSLLNVLKYVLIPTPVPIIPILTNWFPPYFS